MRATCRADGERSRPGSDIAYQVVAGSLRLRRREDEGDIVIAREQAGTPAALEHPAATAETEVIRIGFGWPRNLLSIVGTGKPGWARLIGEADLSTKDQLAALNRRLVWLQRFVMACGCWS